MNLFLEHVFFLILVHFKEIVQPIIIFYENIFETIESMTGYIVGIVFQKIFYTNLLIILIIISGFWCRIVCMIV